MKETNFKELKDNFDIFCKTINEENQAISLNLKSNRKVLILPEENYDAIQKFCVTLSPQLFHK